MGRRARRGFTFVEMMVVAGLFAVVSVVLFTSFSMGLRVWKNATRPDIGQHRSLLALERYSFELRQLRPGLSNFTGGPDSCSFLLLSQDRIENVTYAFDLQRGMLSREVAFLEGDMETAPPRRRVLVTGISNGRFSYVILDNGEERVLESWNTTESLPGAVRAEIELEDGTRVSLNAASTDY